VKEQCPFFEVLRIVIRSDVIGDDRLDELSFKKKACCTHPRSRHRIDMISSSAACGGYLEKCDLETGKGDNFG
jgi:hypothetical protein